MRMKGKKLRRYLHALQTARVWLRSQGCEDYMQNSIKKYAQLRHGIILSGNYRAWFLKRMESGEFKGLPSSWSARQRVRAKEVLTADPSASRWISKKGKIKYAAYLNSDQWKEIRRAVLDRDGNRCRECGQTGLLHVHHLTYNHITEEWGYLSDLITLCKKCHDAKHHKRKTDKQKVA